MKKIPSNAKKVFEGIIFDVYQWDQEMFDGTTDTFEAIRKRDAATVIATCEGKIILNNEEQPGRSPFIALPGGLFEKDEVDPLSNAKRELLEETGLHSDDWSLWFVSDPLNNTKIEWSNYFFIAKDCKKVGEQKLDPGERIISNYITFEEFLELKDNALFRNKDLKDKLDRAARDESERIALQTLLGITK